MNKPTKFDNRRAQLRAAQIQQAKRAKNQRIALFSVIGVVVIALVVAGVLLVNRFSQSEVTVAGTPPHATAAQDGIIANPGQAAEGAPKVEVFLDYQCPACAQFEATFGPQLLQMGENGEIDLIFRTMTFLDANMRNDASTRAANAAACADLTGRYTDYHMTVFANQGTSGYTDEQLTETFPAQAGITGAELDTFSQCYADKDFRGFVNKVDDEAGRSGVTGTPTLHVNGEEVDRTQLTSPVALRELLLAS